MKEKPILLTLESDSMLCTMIKFVFGIDVTKISNLCPIFWLGVASIFCIIPVSLFRIIVFPFKWVRKKYKKYIQNKIEKIAAKITPEELYIWYDSSISRSYIQKKYNIKKEDIFREIYKISMKLRGKNIYETFTEEEEASARKLLNEIWTQYYDAQDREFEQKAKKKEILQKLNNLLPTIKMKPMNTTNLSGLIKITKFITGICLTILLGCVLWTMISILSYFVILLCDTFYIWIAPTTIILMSILMSILFGIGINILLYRIKEYQLPKWIQPIKSFLMYVLYYPIYFLFISFLWKFIVVGFLYGILKGFWRGLVSSTGIFGQYFGSAYTDYCPGVIWKKEENE